MHTSILGWTTLAEDPLVLARSYEISEGEHARSLAVRLPSGKLMLISPPSDLQPSERDALRSHCGVEALVSTQGLAHQGLGPCHSAFPQAVIYTCSGTEQPSREQHRLPPRIEPIAALAAALGDKIRVIPTDGEEASNVLVHIHTEQGVLLYAADAVTRIRKPSRQATGLI